MENEKELSKNKEGITTKSISDEEGNNTSTKKMEDDPENSGDFESLIDEFDEKLKELEEGTIVSGEIINITNDAEVIIDIGYKSEGIVDLNEFKNPDELKIGDRIEIFLEKKENKEGLVVLSRKRAEFYKMWDKFAKIHNSNKTIKGKVIERVKGGLSVNIGVKAFLPGSQIDITPIKDFDQFIGEEIDLKIVKLNKKRRNIVVSRKAALLEEKEKEREELLENLKEGMVVTGIVKNITNFGVFVDIGGLDGLIHITDLTWGRVDNPSEILSLGDEIEVKILKYEKDKERVSLGLKQLTPHPWETIDERYKEGDIVEGKIVSLTNYGAFMEIEEGIEGLIHVSELSWTENITKPSEVLKLNSTQKAKILNIDKENRRISLGIKQLTKNPWDILEENFPVGHKFKAPIKSITDFGLFIEVQEGIDGLIHISDISWTGRIENPRDLYEVGEEIETIVLGIDKQNKRVSLGIKQLREDPWSKVDKYFSVGDDVTGEVIKITGFGAIIKLPYGIEGLLHISQISNERLDKVENELSLGDVLTLKIISINKTERKISLSRKAVLKDRDHNKRRS
jgi:small subunit ribosomal protein S1